MALDNAAVEQACHSLESDAFGGWLATFGRDGLRDLVGRVAHEFNEVTRCNDREIEERLEGALSLAPERIDTSRFRL